MGKFNDAQPLLERALAITEKTLGLEHLEIGIQMNNLGSLLQTMGRLEEALPLMERALPIYEQQMGVAHEKTVLRANNLVTLREQVNQRRLR